MNTFRIVAAGVLAALVIAGVAYAYARWNAMARDLEVARAQLATADAVNEANAAVVQELIEQRKRDAETMTRLHDDMAAIRAKVVGTYDAVRKLGVNNAMVREYLSQPVPDELRGVLNDAPEAAR